MVYRLGQVLQGVVVAGGGFRKRLALLLAAPHLFAHPLPEADVGVGPVLHRQQVPVFGVEDEQQAVEQHQSGFAHICQIGGRGRGGYRRGQIRKGAIENELREILGNALLEVAPLPQGAFVQVVAGLVSLREGAAVEQQREQLQGVAAFVRVRPKQAIVAAGQVQRHRQIDFEELIGYGVRPLPVQPPLGAVGENAPTRPAVPEALGAAQVAQHLRRGRQGFAVSAGGAVQGAQPALGFHQHGADGVAGRPFRHAEGTGLGAGVAEQQAIRHIFPPHGAQVLLPQVGRPAEAGENRPDQVVFCVALVGARCAATGERLENALCFGDEGVELVLAQGAPLWQFADRVPQVVRREQAAVDKGQPVCLVTHRVHATQFVDWGEQELAGWVAAGQPVQH